MEDQAIRRKVLHVTFKMEIGGTEQVICQIVENSDAEKFEHEVLCIDGKIGSLGQRLKAGGFYVTSISRRRGLDTSLFRYIRNLLLERDISVMHCHQYTPYFYGALAALGTGVKLVFTEHGRFYPDRHNFKRRFINPLLAFRTRHITAISKATADAVAEYEYLPRKKIKVIYNGIRDLSEQTYDKVSLLQELGLSPDYRYIGTISRLEPIKNQTMMIKAFHRVRHRASRVKLILIGDGAKRPDLESLVKSLNISEDVIFTGYIDNPQKYLNLFEIFLLSSFSEGTSMTLLEAMSLSRPSVVTDVGGNTELVTDNETGLVVPSDDEAAFSEAILRLLDNDSSLEAFGKMARDRYRSEFPVSKMIDSYQHLYLT